ncbi:hypothetical protein RB195_001253 [Necator americanus]|uniref:Uncharacterized protein n=1 Tax=Necator americanus TaxID=51031 RepID=A0ABR1DDE5_NECAM
MERLEFRERKLLWRLFGYIWPRVCHNEELYAEVDVMYRRMEFVGFKLEEATWIWENDEWINSQALAEDREGWAELCSRTTHLGEDADNRVRRHQP